jgi:hypothetical protein|mmetsp:Transcript_43410/g.68748  ORF Transcript_43410/g.68748 Transcript_43410/m.68748 type:complete len:283 (+) Transcript_43410:69-917(+)
MAKNLPTYSVTVKNTFIDTGVAEDDDLNSEDERPFCRGMLRQMSEPATPGNEVVKFATKFFVPSGEKFEASTTDSCVDNRSTLDDPSDDSSSTGHALERRNEVDGCQEWTDGQQGWRLTEQYWPAWSGDESQDRSMMQYYYCVPGQHAPGDWSCYGMDPYCWEESYDVPACYPSMKLAANALAAAADTRDAFAANPRTAISKARMAAKRFNKRESLIDRAAKQTQEQVQKDKDDIKQKFLEPAGASKAESGAKEGGAKVCSGCGGNCKAGSKFCQYCGKAVA